MLLAALGAARLANEASASLADLQPATETLAHMFMTNETPAMLATLRTVSAERAFADVTRARLGTAKNPVPAARPLPLMIDVA